MINADKKRIYTDGKLLYADLTYRIRGAIFNVYNALGYGHKEMVYQKALANEFLEQEIPYKKEENINVRYKDQVVGNYRPDFVVDNKIVIEIKAVEFMPKSYEIQLIHYLKTIDYQVGLLVNFGSSKLFIKRFVWTGNQCKSAINQR